MVCFVVAGFLLTSASRGPSAIAELLVQSGHHCYLEFDKSQYFIGKRSPGRRRITVPNLSKLVNPTLRWVRVRVMVKMVVAAFLDF